MRIGVIGYGYWGPNLARNFAELEGAELRWCADTKADRRALAKRRYPAVNVTADANDIFGDDAVDAVVIATPVFTHHALARQALERGKHVLVEKPMTRTVKEGEDLVALAEKKGLVLMVDHTFVYTGAVRKMKDILDVGELGDLHYLDSVRVTTQDGIYDTLIDYRTGDMWAPKLDNREALAVECEHFLDCVRFKKVPWTSAAAGLTVVRLLEAAERSLAAGGTQVML